MSIDYISNREKTIKFTVPSSIGTIDVKTFLRKHCGISARTLSKLKRTHLGITKNGVLLKTNEILHSGEIVEIAMPDDVNEIVPIKGDLDILFEDDYLIIINKPSQMPVHPTKIHQEDTLANILCYYMQQKNEHYTFRAVNRLDRDTSGCVLIAKDRFSANSLQKNLRKEYVAMCEGELNSCGTVDKPIKVMQGRSIQRVVSTDGPRAITHYFPLKINNGHTLTRFVLETGRTHQIRCHMSSIGHQLAGDDMYGGSLELIKRQALHCYKMSFVHPVSKETIEITCHLPKDMCQIFNSDRLSI